MISKQGFNCKIPNLSFKRAGQFTKEELPLKYSL